MSFVETCKCLSLSLTLKAVSVPRSLARPFISFGRSFLPPLSFFTSCGSLLPRSGFFALHFAIGFSRFVPPLVPANRSLRASPSVTAGAHVGTASVRFSLRSGAIEFRNASLFFLFPLRERSRLLLSLRSSARSRSRGRASFRFARATVWLRSSAFTFARFVCSRVVWDFAPLPKGRRKIALRAGVRLAEGVRLVKGSIKLKLWASYRNKLF